MPKQRADIFLNIDDVAPLDVGSFAPKSGADAKAPPAEQVRAVTEASQFFSREAMPKGEGKAKRSARRYRTGRNVQFAVKARQETVDAVYKVADAKGWVLGYTLQRAIEALQRELASST
jgi:hypothetical protein